MKVREGTTTNNQGRTKRMQPTGWSCLSCLQSLAQPVSDPRRCTRIKNPDMSVSIEVRRGQLAELLAALDDLNAVLDLDPRCTWIDHFRRCLDAGKQLLTNGTQDELNAFSSQVVSVYGGMGSFNDYCPCPQHERRKASNRLHSMENLVTFSGAVYERAIELRVVGIR